MPTFNFNVSRDDNEWYDIPGYKYYKITKTGLVKRVESYVTSKIGVTRIFQERILRTKTNKSGYVSLTLCKNGIPKGEFIHVLLAKTFIPNPNNLPIIHHKDENPSNNSLDNLEWCDYSHNAKYSINTIKKSHSKEQRSILRIDIISGEVKRYNGIREAAVDNNTNHSNIRQAIIKNRKCKGYKWAYENFTDDELNAIAENNKHKKQIIAVKNIITKEVAYFDNVNDAINYMGISKTHFYRLLHRSITEFNKYKFWYE